MSEDMKRKLTSRKFWLSVAAFLGAVAVSISGITTGNELVTSIGVISGVLSAAIYAACEAYVDAAGTGLDEGGSCAAIGVEIGSEEDE